MVTTRLMLAWSDTLRGETRGNVHFVVWYFFLAPAPHLYPRPDPRLHRHRYRHPQPHPRLHPPRSPSRPPRPPRARFPFLHVRWMLPCVAGVLPRSVSDHANIIRVVAMDPTLPTLPIMMEAGSRDMFDVIYDADISMAAKIRQVRKMSIKQKKQKCRMYISHTHARTLRFEDESFDVLVFVLGVAADVFGSVFLQ